MIQRTKVKRNDEDGEIAISPLLSIDVSGQIVCPQCSGNYIHLARLLAEQGSVTLGAANDQVKAYQHDEPSNRRGSVVALMLSCEECSQVTEITLQQHKACLYGSAEVVAGVQHGTAPQLWRD
ncbi:hypothetical protein [Fuerstiella marisgermanici]|uniref:Uncharacterized protein n=1 Tax=Fuerstiella marisgermanici TaxID=1891926 RepID=A0A1P8WDN1_9PLAN|nr:hypothetical protein [Fuerstiella marisgermanici]APZ92173.1 hypothetical protein Fuma_01781 [Fuerstiella marisgermanici]